MNKAIQSIDEYGLKDKTKGAWIEICYANIVGLMCLGLAFFLLPLGITLSLIVFVYLEPGIYGFAFRMMRKESAGYETLFTPLKEFPKVLALKLVAMASILLWGLLLIVPGVIVALNYAFVPLAYFENKESDIRAILSQSRNLTSGVRFKIMLMFLLAVVLVCAGVSFGFGVYSLIGLFVSLPVYVMIILLLIFGGLAVIFLALPFYQSFVVACYESQKVRFEEQNSSKNEKVAKKVVNKC